MSDILDAIIAVVMALAWMGLIIGGSVIVTMKAAELLRLI